MSAENIERRRERRVPASGEVRLWIEGTGRAEVGGRLVDISRSGFRAAHPCAALSAGDQVRFLHSRGQGQARVMWTRVAGTVVESGFLVLQ